MMKTVVGAALAGVGLLTSGCSGSSQAQVASSASPGFGSGDALVLRVRTSGGFAGLGGPGSMPDFSLYGDGRAITGGAHPTEYHLTREAFERLVADASRAGLATPHTTGNPRVADAMYKVVTFVTGGRARTTRIIEGGGDPTDPAARFLARLVPARWPRGDQSADPRPYQPARVAVLAVASPGQNGPTWPFKPLGSGIRVGTRTCTLLTGTDVARVQRVAGRPQWRDGGQTFRVTIRPLLPDERDCAALRAAPSH